MFRFKLFRSIRFAAVVGLASIIGCGTPNGGGGDEVVLAPETIVVDDTDSVQVEEIREESVVLAPDSVVSVGDILAGETSEGAYLRKVVEIETQLDGSILVETEQASIEEAVTVGSASISQKVYFDAGGTLVNGKTMPSGKALDTDGFSIVSDAAFDLVIDHLSIDFNPDIDLDLRYSWGLKEFRAVVSGDLDIDLQATANVLGSVSDRYEREIAEIPGPPIVIPTPLFGIPIEVTPVLEIIGGVEVNASGSGSATCRSGLTLSTEAGVHYEEGDWSLIGNTDQESRSPQLVYEFEAAANVTVYVKVQVLFKFFHIAGPHIGIAGGLGVEAEAALSPPGTINWELYWSIAGSAGGSMEILSKKIFDMSFELFEFQFVIDEGTIGGNEPEPVCGNGTCEVGETSSSCPADCDDEGPVCGNGTCESGETSSNCPADCDGQTPTGETLTLDLGGGVTMELVRIPDGSFMMGTDSTDYQWLEYSRPVHSVTISRDFYIGRYEVTQAQWEAVMGDHPSYFDGCDDCPVEVVSWEDAVDFCDTLSAMTGYDIRLPTEAEWEYSCRAGTTTEYSFGDDESDLGDYAWYDNNSGSQTHDVGGKLPNPWGLYDMHGNVWEWCEDVWHDDYSGVPSDGSAWTTGGDSSLRVVRGGAWSSYDFNLRSANRVGSRPDTRYNGSGFRVAAGT
jgi:formylglycine-generating enzyme required for sulfatase activity